MSGASRKDFSKRLLKNLISCSTSILSFPFFQYEKVLKKIVPIMTKRGTAMTRTMTISGRVSPSTEDLYLFLFILSFDGSQKHPVLCRAEPGHSHREYLVRNAADVAGRTSAVARRDVEFIRRKKPLEINPSQAEKGRR